MKWDKNIHNYFLTVSKKDEIVKAEKCLTAYFVEVNLLSLKMVIEYFLFNLSWWFSSLLL